MLKLYEYLYYRLYSWNKKLHGEKDGPEFNASLGIAMLLGLQIVDIILLFDIILMTKYKNYNLLNTVPREVYIGIMIVLIVITFFWFVYKRKYLKIIKKYNGESKKKRQIKLVILWVFVLFSLFMLFFLATTAKGLN